MKSVWLVRLSVPLCGIALGLSLMAQGTNPATSVVSDRDGQVIAPVNAGATDSLDPAASAFHRNDLGATIRERLQSFEQLRKAYLERQRTLTQKLRGASEDERDMIRQQLRETRQQWLDQARQLREQARERLQELKERLPNHGEILDAAREQAREQVREGLEAARERARRGTD